MKTVRPRPDCGSREIRTMKTLLRGNHIPRRDIEGLNTAAEIFEYLEDKGVIGDNDLSFLKTLLIEIDRQPLVKAVESCERELNIDSVQTGQVTGGSSTTPGVNGVDDLLAEILKSVGGSSGQVRIKGRDIMYRSKGRVHSLRDPWVYDAWAVDIASREERKASHYKDENDAIKEALRRIVDHLTTQGLL
ncbi:uncharacterized protein [Ptychodera flava]|uniref:uncharacterized protein isoform X2 n=1 Tax=Ptychodera flava TaxID=63121 RepID=UPI00396A0355